jgi:hypothetical protein
VVVGAQLIQSLNKKERGASRHVVDGLEMVTMAKVKRRDEDEGELPSQE